MSDPLAGIAGLLRDLAAALGIGVGGVKGAKLLFGYTPGSIPVCHTVVVREGRGLPWARQLAVHPLKDGRLEISVLAAPSNPSSGEEDTE